MLTIAMQAMLGQPGVIFADSPYHLTHTAFIEVDEDKDLSPIGRQPYRLMFFQLENDVTVGMLADLFTRIDLVYKALVGSKLP